MAKRAKAGPICFANLEFLWKCSTFWGKRKCGELFGNGGCEKPKAPQGKVNRKQKPKEMQASALRTSNEWIIFLVL